MFDKRDIVEVAEELGIELTYHEHTDRPYYMGFCPLHDNVKTPAFVIFPRIQRFYCYGCTPEGGDVIDLIRKKEGLSFKQAVQRVTIALTAEDSFLKRLKQNTNTVDLNYLQIRAMKLNDEPRRLNFNTVQRLYQQFDFLISENRWLEADHLLRKVGA
jgi:DNA primase